MIMMKNEVYTAPVVEVIEVQVERGFAASLTPENGNA